MPKEWHVRDPEGARSCLPEEVPYPITYKMLDVSMTTFFLICDMNLCIVVVAAWRLPGYSPRRRAGLIGAATDFVGHGRHVADRAGCQFAAPVSMPADGSPVDKKANGGAPHRSRRVFVPIAQLLLINVQERTGRC